MTISRNFSRLASNINASGTVLTTGGGTNVIAPGASGNVLASDGTNWVSAVPSGGGATITNDTTSNVTLYPTLANVTTGTLSTAYTSSSKLQFNPLSGELTADRLISDNGVTPGSWTTTTRPTGVAAGTMGYNTDTGLLEVYSVGGWVTVASGSNGVGLWAWGDNYYGGLGLGGLTSYSSPVQVGALAEWNLVKSGRYNSLAIRTDGTLWAWGKNQYGQLGLGSPPTACSSPIQVGGLTNWSQIALGRSESFAIKTDNTLWAWGNNSSGQLGQNNTTNWSTPVQVGGLWSNIASGDAFSLAIKTDGTLWGWGNNSSGQLGQNNTTNYSSPVQVGSLTTWSKIACGSKFSLAIKTDGTLWAWGYNDNGQLGLGDRTHRSSPVQVGALTTWSKVSAGDSTTMAIKTDGTLWAWGNNYYGQLGLGTSGFGNNKSSPTQVGALTTWSLVSEGQSTTMAIKTDGTLWAWGYNDNGQLGLGDRTRRSSPTQVGALTTWSLVSTGVASTLAITQ